MKKEILEEMSSVDFYLKYVKGTEDNVRQFLKDSILDFRNRGKNETELAYYLAENGISIKSLDLNTNDGRYYLAVEFFVRVPGDEKIFAFESKFDLEEVDGRPIEEILGRGN